MFFLQLSDEVDADVDPVGFEVDEIEAASIVGLVELSCEINELCERSTDLEKTSTVVSGGILRASFGSSFQLRGARGQCGAVEMRGGKRQKKREILTSTATWLTTPV